MSEGDGSAEATLHRLRSTLTRLRFEIDLAESLSKRERERLLSTVAEMAALLQPLGE